MKADTHPNEKLELKRPDTLPWVFISSCIPRELKKTKTYHCLNIHIFQQIAFLNFVSDLRKNKWFCLIKFTVKSLLQAWASIRIITIHGDRGGPPLEATLREKSVAPIYQ